MDMILGILIGILITSLAYIFLFIYIDDDGHLKRAFAFRLKKKIFKNKHKHKSPFIKTIGDPVVVPAKTRSVCDEYEGLEYEGEKDIISDCLMTTDAIEVVVVNGAVESGMYGGPLKFNNRELDNHFLFVSPIDQKDEEKIGGKSVIQVLANQYKREWDDIKEYTLGTLKVNNHHDGRLKTTRVYYRPEYEKYEIILKKDEKTQEFLTMEK